MGEKRTEYKNNFIKENYDRINLITIKGKKETIKQRADKQNKSINAYIVDLIEADLSCNNAQ